MKAAELRGAGEVDREGIGDAAPSVSGIETLNAQAWWSWCRPRLVVVNSVPDERLPADRAVAVPSSAR